MLSQGEVIFLDIKYTVKHGDEPNCWIHSKLFEYYFAKTVLKDVYFHVVVL